MPTQQFVSYIMPRTS